jgi:hypothetical protein
MRQQRLVQQRRERQPALYPVKQPLQNGRNTGGLSSTARIKLGAQAISLTEKYMDLTRKSFTRLPARLFAGALLFAAVAALAPEPVVFAAPCLTSITSCGCTITRSQIYTVANALSPTQTSGNICIDIEHDHAILNTMGFNLTGNGRGIGILIGRGANHVIVEGGPETAAEVNPQSTVSNWDIGIEDDADGAIIQLFANVGNNSTAGISLSRVGDSIIGDLLANGNGSLGIYVDHSSRIEIYNVATSGNGTIGLRLESSTESRVLGTAGNNAVGTWLSNSMHNVLLDDANVSNTDTGLVIGCGVQESHCPGSEESDDNFVVFDTASGNTNAGVLIRKHSGDNTVTLGANGGNNNDNDMVDENNKCDSNIWYNNIGHGNQSCIH